MKLQYLRNPCDVRTLNLHGLQFENESLIQTFWLLEPMFHIVCYNLTDHNWIEDFGQRNTD
jgi:hypothetical protein